jgi:hypothetical protein
MTAAAWPISVIKVCPWDVQNGQSETEAEVTTTTSSINTKRKDNLANY